MRIKADIWVDADGRIDVSAHADMAVLHIGDWCTLWAEDGTRASGPAQRLADLTALRDLARRMLDACEEALAAAREKPLIGQPASEAADIIVATGA